jgi:hypothetical protein
MVAQMQMIALPIVVDGFCSGCFRCIFWMAHDSIQAAIMVTSQAHDQ